MVARAPLRELVGSAGTIRQSILWGNRQCLVDHFIVRHVVRTRFVRRGRDLVCCTWCFVLLVRCGGDDVRMPGYVRGEEGVRL